MLVSNFEKTKRENKRYSFDEFEEKVARRKDQKMKDKVIQQKRKVKRQDDDA